MGDGFRECGCSGKAARPCKEAGIDKRERGGGREVRESAGARAEIKQHEKRPSTAAQTHTTTTNYTKLNREREREKTQVQGEPFINSMHICSMTGVYVVRDMEHAEISVLARGNKEERTTMQKGAKGAGRTQRRNERGKIYMRTEATNGFRDM